MDPLLGTFLCYYFNFIGIILNFHISEYKHFLGRTFMTRFKVGQSKPPPVLTSSFNRLKPPRSICKKVVNTGLFESEWLIEIFKRPFWSLILGQV